MSPLLPSISELMVDNLLCQLHLTSPLWHLKSAQHPSLLKTADTSNPPQTPEFKVRKDPRAVYEALLSRSTLLPIIAGLVGYLLTANSEKTKVNPLLVAALAAFGTDWFRRAQAARQLGQPQAGLSALEDYSTFLGLTVPPNPHREFPDYLQVWQDLKDEFDRQQQAKQQNNTQGP